MPSKRVSIDVNGKTQVSKQICAKLQHTDILKLFLNDSKEGMIVSDPKSRPKIVGNSTKKLKLFTSLMPEDSIKL